MAGAFNRALDIGTPIFPSKLPFESELRSLLNRASHVSNSVPIRMLNQFISSTPYLAEKQVGTPLGLVKLPPLDLPVVKVPEMDDRQMEAMKAAIGKDLSYIPALIPVVGDTLANITSDTFEAKISEILTSDEWGEFKRWDKKSPLSAIAMAQTLVRRG